MVRHKSTHLNLSLDRTDIPKLRLLSTTPTLQNYLYTTLCTLPDGSLYPPRSIRTRQTRWAAEHLEARPSRFAGGGLGLFAKSPLPENTLLGFYGGTITSTLPADTSYALELSRPKPFYKKNVDAKAHLKTHGYLGLINEYIWTLDVYDPHSAQNCKFALDGTGAVYTTCDIQVGTELTIYLGSGYNWASLIDATLNTYLLEHGYHSISSADINTTTTPHVLAAIYLISTDKSSPWHFRRRNKPALQINYSPQRPKLHLSSLNLPRTYQQWTRYPHSDATSYIRRLRTVSLPAHLPRSIWLQLGSPLSHLNHYSSQTISYIISKLHSPFHHTVHFLSPSDTDNLCRGSYIPPDDTPAVYYVIFQRHNTWCLYSLDITESFAFLIDPRSTSTLNIQLHTSFASQLLSKTTATHSINLCTVLTPTIPDSYMSGPFVVYMMTSFFQSWPIPQSIHAIKYFHANLFHSSLLDSFTADEGSISESPDINRTDTYITTRYGSLIDNSQSLIPLSQSLSQNPPTLTETSSPHALISAPGSLNTSQLNSPALSTKRRLSPSPLSSSATPAHRVIVLRQPVLSSPSFSQISSSPSPILSSTPTFVPERICASLHKQGIRCPVCNATPDLKINPSHRHLLQAYSDYCKYQTDQLNQYSPLILSTDHKIKVCSFNINTLSHNKTMYICWLFDALEIDVLILIDTRQDDASSQYFKRLIHYYHPDAAVCISPCLSLGTTAATRVGGQLIIVRSKWSSNMSPYKPDHTKLGIISSITLNTTSSKLIIHALYIPFKSTNPTDNSLYKKLAAWIHANHLTADPINYLLDYISQQTSKHPSCKHILAGDLNSTWPNSDLHQWALPRNWSNPIHDITHVNSSAHSPIYSRYTSNSKSLIDHILLRNATCAEIGTLDNTVCTVSDHQPIWLSVLCDPPGNPPTKVIKPTIAIKLKQFTDKSSEQYRKYISDRNPTLDISLTSADHANTLLDRLSSSIMEATIKQSSHKKHSKRKRYDGWSPTMIYFTLKLRFLTRVLALLRRSISTRQLLLETRRQLLKWQSYIMGLSPDQRDTIPKDQKGIPYWTSIPSDPWLPLLLTSITHTKQKLTATERHQLHNRLYFYSKTVRQHFHENKLGSVITSLLGSKSTPIDFSYIDTDSDHITAPDRIHQHLTTYAGEYHASDSIRPIESYPWYSTQDTLAHFTDYITPHIPAAYHHTIEPIWHGFHFNDSSTQQLHIAERIQTVLATPPTLEQFTQSLRHKSSDSAPGVSGLSFQILKRQSPDIIEYIYKLLLYFHSNKIHPNSWYWKYLCYIPKNSGPIVFTNLRPLMLIESLRKLWIELILYPVLQIWQTEQLLSPAQHGYTHRRSTTTATMVLLNFLESHDTVYINSWDFKKAFDSISTPLIRIAMTRMGTPDWFSDWLMNLDTHGTTVVRTPFAQNQWSSKGYRSFESKHVPTFQTQKGVGQGDVHSAHTWKIVLDILLRSLESVFPDVPFRSLSLEELLAYADDLLTLCTTIEQLQLLADIISSFCNLTGLQLSIDKLRAFIKTNERNLPQVIRISSHNWEIKSLTLTVNGALRYLGCTHDLTPYANRSTQFNLTRSMLIKSTDTLLSKVRLHYRPAVMRAYTLQTVPRSAYAMAITYTSTPQFDELNRIHRKLIKPLTLNLRQFPTKLLTIPKSHLGLDVIDPSMAILKSQNRIIFSMLSDPNMQIIMQGHISRTLAQQHTTYAPFHTASSKSTPTTTYLSTIIKTFYSFGLQLQILGYSPNNGNHLISQLLISPASIEYATSLGYLRLTDLLTTQHGSVTWNLPHRLSFIPDKIGPNKIVAEPFTLYESQYWILNSRLLYITRLTTSAVYYTISLQTPLVGETVQLHETNYSIDITLFTPSHRVIVSINRVITAINSSLTPTIPDLPQDSWVHMLRQNLSTLPYTGCVIYTDGAWKDSSDIISNFLLGTTDMTCSASIVIMKSTDWNTNPIQPIKVLHDGPPITSAYILELIAISAASSIATHTTIYTDCQSAVSILATHDLNKLINTDNYFLLNHIHSSLKRNHNTLLWTPSHPERRQPNRTLWTQHDWGNYLADAFASNHLITNKDIQLRHQVNITTKQVLNNCNYNQWAWIHGKQLLLLSPLQHIKIQTHSQYITTRDQNRLASSTIPWHERKVTLASRILDSSTITQSSRSCRLVYDLYQHGRNKAKSGHHSAACPLCSYPADSLKHILVDCQHPVQLALRKQYLRDYDSSVNSCVDSTSISILREIRSLALTHPSGYMLLFGVWTQHLHDLLQQRLSPSVRRDYRQLSLLKRHLTKPLRILADMSQILASQCSQLVRQLTGNLPNHTTFHKTKLTLKRRWSCSTTPSTGTATQTSLTSYYSLMPPTSSQTPSDHSIASTQLLPSTSRKTPRATATSINPYSCLDDYIARHKKPKPVSSNSDHIPDYWTHPNDFNNTHSPATLKRNLTVVHDSNKKQCQQKISDFFLTPVSQSTQVSLPDTIVHTNIKPKKTSQPSVKGRPLTAADLDSNQLASSVSDQNDYFTLQLGKHNKAKQKKKKKIRLNVPTSQDSIDTLSLIRGPQ